MHSYYLNLFHIIFVGLLLYALTSNLASGHDTLKLFTYIVIGAMVGYHGYLLYNKTNGLKNF